MRHSRCGAMSPCGSILSSACRTVRAGLIESATLPVCCGADGFGMKSSALRLFRARSRSCRTISLVTFGVLALIVLAGLAGPLLAVGRQALVPVVVGELLAGVVIGISGFRWLDPAEPTTAFLAEVGFAMLMFAAGMNVPLRQPGSSRGFGAAALAAVVAALLAVPFGIAAARATGTHHAAIYALAAGERVGGDPAAGAGGAAPARRSARADGDGAGGACGRRSDRRAPARARAGQGAGGRPRRRARGRLRPRCSTA